MHGEDDMAKTVIPIFHGDDASLSAGSRVAERVRHVVDDVDLELEVYRFASAQDAITSPVNNEVHAEYRAQIDALVASGVRVGACLNAAVANETEDELRRRGVTLEYARDAFARAGLEGAAVIGWLAEPPVGAPALRALVQPDRVAETVSS